MKEYSFTEAQQHFAFVLNEAKREGTVCVKQEDNKFYIREATSRKSPLDVEGVDLGISAAEIVELSKKVERNQHKV